METPSDQQTLQDPAANKHRQLPWLAVTLSLLVLAVLGVLGYQNILLKKQIAYLTPTSPQLSPPPPAPPINPMADWKTYTNSTYGYSINYPPDFTVSFCKDCNPPDVDVSLNNQDKSISIGIEYGHQFSLCANNPSPCEPVNNLTVAIQEKTYQLEEYYIDYYKYYLYKIEDALKNGMRTQISIAGHYSSLQDADKLSQILSTFKFTDQNQAVDETKDWKTYNNPDMTFKYPSNWTLNGVAITASTPKIKIVIAPKDSTLMNECMQLTATEDKGNVVIKKFSRITTGEMCATSDSTPQEIWIIPSATAYSPGISFQYLSTEKQQAESIFDQILSTFKFTN